MKITIEFEVDEKSMFQKTSTSSLSAGLQSLIHYLEEIRRTKEVSEEGEPTHCALHPDYADTNDCPLCILEAQK
jgi:hypothetical protein